MHLTWLIRSLFFILYFYFVQIFSLFLLCLLFLYIYYYGFILCTDVFCWCGGSLAPNEDIVRSRCGKREVMLQAFEKGKKERKFFRKNKRFYVFSCFSEFFSTILINFDPLYLDYYLLYKYGVHNGFCPKCVILGPNLNPHSSF